MENVQKRNILYISFLHKLILFAFYKNKQKNYQSSCNNSVIKHAKILVNTISKLISDSLKNCQKNVSLKIIVFTERRSGLRILLTKMEGGQ